MIRTALILGGGVWQLDLIRRVKELGYQTVVADISPDAPGSRLADVFVAIDTDDRQRLLALARTHKVAVVLSDQSDRVVPMVGYLNGALGLRGIDEATAQRFTNKLLMRDGLVGHGVAMPAYSEVGSVDEAIDWAQQQGFPVVLKPKQSWASLGVKKVDNVAHLRYEYPRSMQQSRDGKLLIEEFIDGVEVTVEGFSIGGKNTTLAISEKEHYAESACVARRLAYPPRMSDAILERIRQSATRAANGLGLQDGISHAEFKLHGGVPYLVEIAARGGGNRISSVIVPHICGFDLYDLLLRRLRGEDANLPECQHHAAILQFFNFPPGKVSAIRGLEQVEREQLVYQLDLPIKPGDVIVSPDNDRARIGFFIALGETRDEVDQKAARVEQLVQVEYSDRASATERVGASV